MMMFIMPGIYLIVYFICKVICSDDLAVTDPILADMVMNEQEEFAQNIVLFNHVHVKCICGFGYKFIFHYFRCVFVFVVIFILFIIHVMKVIQGQKTSK